MVEAVLFDLLHLDWVSPFSNYGKEFDAPNLLGNTPVIASLNDEVDILTFIGKEFWFHVFKKEIDCIRIDNEDLYVLQDNSFMFLRTTKHSYRYLRSGLKSLSAYMWTCTRSFREFRHNICSNS
ncbi:trafficking protein particle complex subunit 6B-like [Parasteatoda tepidariorum]|uniref:trafficking protein particle complex subunit 6B-like n=1 Tax=Parasteatoda tepidariorum TaxID=114398 RepID=UPI00077F9C24